MYFSFSSTLYFLRYLQLNMQKTPIDITLSLLTAPTALLLLSWIRLWNCPLRHISQITAEVEGGLVPQPEGWLSVQSPPQLNVSEWLRGHSYAHVIPLLEFHFLLIIIVMITVMTIAAPVLHRKPKRDSALLRAVVTIAWVAKYAKCLLRVNYPLCIIEGRLRSVLIMTCFNSRCPPACKQRSNNKHAVQSEEHVRLVSKLQLSCLNFKVWQHCVDHH